MALVFRLLGMLPLWALYPLGSLAAFVALRLVRWRVARARDNLARCLPDRTPEEREGILAASYRNLGEKLAEAVWGWSAGGEALSRRVRIENRELIDGYVRERRSVILLTAHLGNWEWLLLAAGASLGVPIDPVYKPMRNAGLEAYVRRARGRFGGRPIPTGELLFELLQAHGEPHAYGMLADQTPPVEARKVWLRFLNRDTAFYAGLGRVARYLDAPVVFVSMHRVTRGRYTAHLHVLAQPPYDDDPELAIVAAYAGRLEAEIRRNPSDWLWVHHKWKYPKPADADARVAGASAPLAASGAGGSPASPA